MRLEHLPILLGVLFGLIGAGLVADALIADGTFVAVERRRRARAPRHPRGELLVGIGVLAIAAALIGRDQWRWGTVAVLAGVLLVTFGSLLNWRFLVELFSNRGALRRAENQASGEQATRGAAPGAAAGAAPGPGEARAHVVRRAPQVPGTPATSASPGAPARTITPVTPPPGAPAPLPRSAAPGAAPPVGPVPPVDPTIPGERRSAPPGGEGPRRIR